MSCVFSCADIDECALGDHACMQHCKNTPGGHSCYCDPGYVLRNGTDCESESEQNIFLQNCPRLAQPNFLKFRAVTVWAVVGILIFWLDDFTRVKHEFTIK